jgi:PhnB protein
MRWNPHISFSGDCEAAFQFYAACFRGEVAFMLTWGASPMAKDVPPEWGGKVCHATLKAGDNVLTGADAPPGRSERPSGFQILLGVDDATEAERIFTALAEGGSIKMPIQQTFWSTRFGVVTDRFGVPWAINCENAR